MTAWTGGLGTLRDPRSILWSQVLTASLHLPPCYNRASPPKAGQRDTAAGAEQPSRAGRGEEKLTNRAGVTISLEEARRLSSGQIRSSRHAADYLSWWEFFAEHPGMTGFFAAPLLCILVFAAHYERPRPKYDPNTKLLQVPEEGRGGRDIGSPTWGGEEEEIHARGYGGSLRGRCSS